MVQARVLARVCRQSYSKKTANIALRHQRFRREMTFEDTDDLHYSDMGGASDWLKNLFQRESLAYGSSRFDSAL